MLCSTRRLPAVLGLVVSSLLICHGPAAGHRLFSRVPNPDGRFAGQVVDLTNNHGADHRLWSAALGEKRDLYIYLPPGYHSSKQYPLVFWLHGIIQDEKGFLKDGLPQIDAAMAAGR